MNTTSTLTVTTPSELEIAITREFDAPRQLVWDAHTKPELIRQWMLGPDGWSMPVCDMDLRVGGKLRYVWRRDATGEEMTMSGEFREIAPPERLVHSEHFEDPWYPGEAIVTTTFLESAGRTTLRITMLMESKEGRDMVLKSGMETGMEVGYVRLDRILAGMQR